MVSFNVNVCGCCDEELVGREEVEAIVVGKERLSLARRFMRWDTYSSGGTFMYAEVQGQTGSRGVTKNIVCGCNAQRGISPSAMMIRPEHRNRVGELFGDKLSIPLLFSLPASMVAWENCAMVHVSPSKEGLVLSDDGMKLVEMIAEMSHLGLFDGSVAKFSDEDVLHEFSYLHVIKPKYRSFVAVEFGREATIAKLLSSVSIDWFDWTDMLLLKCAEEQGKLILSRAVGLSSVGDIVKTFSGVDAFELAKPVCDKSAVTNGGTCVQLMPLGADGYEDSELTDTASAVLLGPGQAFVPAGTVELQGEKIAVTFEPGVSVVTGRDTVISAPSGSVTLFVNGTVLVELRTRDMQVNSGFGSYCGHHKLRAFQVSVVCESYDGGTPLGAWYARRFDTLSSSARFFGQNAELLLLASPPNGKLDAGMLDVDAPMIDNERAGVGVQHLQKQQVGFDEVFSASAGDVVWSAVLAWGAPVDVYMNGVLKLSDASSVGTLGRAVLTFRPSGKWEMVSGKRDFSLSIDCTVPIDCDTIDGNSSSGFDGGFEDELFVHLPSKALDVLCHARRTNAVLSYERIAVHGPSMAHELGVRPLMQDLLGVSLHLVDRDKLLGTGIRFANSSWKVVPLADSDLTWEQVARDAASWGTYATSYTTLLDMLCTLFGINRSIFVRPDQTCC